LVGGGRRVVDSKTTRWHFGMSPEYQQVTRIINTCEISTLQFRWLIHK